MAVVPLCQAYTTKRASSEIHGDRPVGVDFPSLRSPWGFYALPLPHTDLCQLIKHFGCVLPAGVLPRLSPRQPASHHLLQVPAFPLFCVSWLLCDLSSWAVLRKAVTFQVVWCLWLLLQFKDGSQALSSSLHPK